MYVWQFINRDFMYVQFFIYELVHFQYFYMNYIFILIFAGPSSNVKFMNCSANGELSMHIIEEYGYDCQCFDNDDFNGSLKCKNNLPSKSLAIYTSIYLNIFKCELVPI